MPKYESPIELTRVGFVDELLNHPASVWFKENWKPICYGILALILSLFILYRFLAIKNAETEHDFRISSQLAALLNNPETSLEKRGNALVQLENLASKNRSLQAKYDGLIAQQLLIEAKIDQAAPYIERTFSRVKGDSPLHLDYASTSILITDGKNEEALKQAYLLRNAMLKEAGQNIEAQHSGVLYAFNLIRIALLERHAGQKSLEAKAWEELNQMSNPLFLIKISPQNLQYIMKLIEGPLATRFDR